MWTTHYGKPARLLCDPASYHKARCLREWCMDKNIQLVHTAPGSHKSTGLVERLNQTLIGRSRRILAEGRHHSWVDRLPITEWTQPQWGRTPQVGNATQRPKRAMEAITKMITSYKTTGRFVPRFTIHREYRTINLSNVTYTIDKYPKMYKTRSSPKTMKTKSSISHNLHFYNTRLHIPSWSPASYSDYTQFSYKDDSSCLMACRPTGMVLGSPEYGYSSSFGQFEVGVRPYELSSGRSRVGLGLGTS